MRSSFVVLNAIAIFVVIQLLIVYLETRTDSARTDAFPCVAESTKFQPAVIDWHDSDFDRQWALSKIMTLEAWRITSGGSVTIAILDTGVDWAHRDLVGKVVAQANYSDSPTAYDLFGHGTHIAGIIAAARNGLGVTGVAYDCNLMNVKIADESGTWKSTAAARGIVWAVNNGANVINLSLSAREASPDLEQAINYAWGKGAVVVCAAGNNTGSEPTYPAYYSNCIAVAATDETDSLAAWSGCGDWVDVSAPGVNIYSTLPFNSYGYKSGTSMAAAYVSGVAGLLFALARDANGNGLVNDEVRAAVEGGCDQTGIKTIGRGRINAFGAVIKLLSSK